MITATKTKAIDQIVNSDDYTEQLSGVKSDIKRIITLGQSNHSKGVLFVLYYYNPNCKSPYVNPMTYAGNLGGTFEIALKNARRKVGHFELLVDDYETYAKRRENNTIPFGKYKGMSIEELFDTDPKYLFWAANNMNVNSKTLAAQFNEYRLLAKELIIKENEVEAKSFLPIETKKVERKLEIISVYNIKAKEYSYDTVKIKLVDTEGNKFYYSGAKYLGKTGDKITVKCRIKQNFNSMGINYNKIVFR